MLGRGEGPLVPTYLYKVGHGVVDVLVYGGRVDGSRDGDAALHHAAVDVLGQAAHLTGLVPVVDVYVAPEDAVHTERSLVFHLIEYIKLRQCWTSVEEEAGGRQQEPGRSARPGLAGGAGPPPPSTGPRPPPPAGRGEGGGEQEPGDEGGHEGIGTFDGTLLLRL